MSDTSNEFVVGKPFLTASSRFRAGDRITKDDIPADNAMRWEDLRSGHFIVGADTKAGQAAVKEASEREQSTDGPRVSMAGAFPAIERTAADEEEIRRSAEADAPSAAGESALTAPEEPAEDAPTNSKRRS